MRKAKLLSVLALMSALGVICLYLGAILDVLDMSAAVLAAVLVLFCVLEFGYGYAGMVYLVISVLALLVLPNKSPALLFAGLFGYVPITKFFFEHKLGKLSWLPKLLVFDLIFSVIVLFGAELMGFTAENSFGIPPYVIYVLYFIFANTIYVLCDILFARLSRIYFLRFREKIHKYLK